MTSKVGSPIVQRLDNGLTVVCLENHHSPVVSLQAWLGVGSADEDEANGEAGLAHVHEHMLFKGTERRGVGEIARAIEAAGGEINAWTSFDNTVYYVSLAARYFDIGLDVLSDAICHSAFDVNELDAEREVILEEIHRSQDIPARVVSQRLFRSAFSQHPYGRPVIGYEETVRDMRRDQLLDFYRRHYRPENLVFVAVGDFQAEQALEKIRASFAAFAPGASTRQARRQEPTQTKVRIHLGFGDTQESHLACAWHIPSADHADVPALDVLSLLLGQGESSRLSRELRFQRHLVNETYAYAYTPRDAGVMIAGAALHHEQLLDATQALLETTYVLCHERVAQRELEKAKTNIEADAVYQRETVQGMARKLGFFQSQFADLDEEQRYYEAIRNLTAEDIRRVAERYLTPEGLTCEVMLPKAEDGRFDEAQLAKVCALRPTPQGGRKVSPAGSSGAHRLVLDSGARLLILPDHSVPIVSFRALWLGGQRIEKPETLGVNNMLARMLTKGTETRSALALAHAVDGMAASLDGFSGRNTLGLQGEFLAKFTEQGFDLLSDCAQHPAFREDDLERERAEVLEHIRSREDSLASLSFRLFAQALYPNHPYRHDPLGTCQSVTGISADKLREVQLRQMGADKSVLVIAGDVDPDRAVFLAEQSFGQVRKKSVPVLGTPKADPPPRRPRVVRLDRDRAQAHVVLGYSGLTFNHPDRYSLEILSSVLSGQSGRLFLDLRDKRSLAYSISAFSVEGLEPGYFAVYIGTAPEKVDAALDGLREHLDRLRQKPPSDEELLRTQRYLIGAHEIGLQRVGARASMMAFNEIYKLGYEAHLDYANQIESVRVEDVQNLAQRLLAPEREVVALIAPAGVGPEGTQEVQLDPDCAERERESDSAL